MATGLNYLFDIDPGITTQVILIVVISIVATISAVSGVGNGIRIISEWNIWLSVVLLAYFLFGGPFKWHDGLLRHLGGRLSLERNPDGFPDLQRCRRFRLARRLDHLLPGAGGSRGRRSWACSSPASAGAGPSANSCWE